MSFQSTTPANVCLLPLTPARVKAEAAFDAVARYCQTCESPFAVFEREFVIQAATLARCLILLFLNLAINDSILAP